MPIRRSVQAYRAAAPMEQALWMLTAIPLAVAIPTLLRWTLQSIADAGRGEGGVPASVSRTAMHAAATLVQWVGIGVLAGLAIACAATAVTYAADARRSRGVSTWAVAEMYALGVLAALAGLLWLA